MKGDLGFALVWLQFALCAGTIWVAGVRLLRYADAIAEKTSMGRAIVGLILLGAVTSLPELVTGISAVTIAQAPDIAIGDVLGGCVLNLAILAIIDAMRRGVSFYASASPRHALSACFGVVLLGIAALGLLAPILGLSLHIGQVGFTTPIIVVVYVLVIRAVYRSGSEDVERYVEDITPRHDQITLRQALSRYLAAAVVVVAAGAWLPFVGADLAEVMGWNTSFVATLFVAVATSVPELAVTIAAVRLGAIDLAVANLLGSNLFNVLIIAINDLFYEPGPILDQVSTTHLFGALTAMLMTSTVAVGFLRRSPSRLWTSLALCALYLVNGVVQFHFGG